MAYSTVTSRQQLDELASKLQALPDNHVVAVDLETTGFAPRVDHTVGFAVSWDDDQAVYVPTWHIDQEDFGFSYPEAAAVLRLLKRLRVVAHKWTFDATFVYADFGVDLPLWDDTRLLSKLTCDPEGLDGAMKQIYHLPEDCVKDFKKLMVYHFTTTFKKKGHTARELPLGGEWGVDNYCCQDADYTRRYYFYLKPKVKKLNLTSLHKIEVNVLPIARKLNLTGVPVNPTLMREATEYVKRDNDTLEQEIYKLAGREFKINSKHDCPQVLFDHLKLPVILRSQKTGSPSTNAEVLDQLSGLHPIVDKIAEWRDSSRMVKAYLEKIPAQLDAKNRIYTEFNPLGAISGRWTSSADEDYSGEDHGTNLQNISKKTFTWTNDTGVRQEKSIRSCFEAPQEFTWVRMDFDQVEPRVQANLAQEPFLIENFKLGYDSHTTTTAICFSCSLDDVVADTRAGGTKRKKGKIINLALSYGMGIDKLARSLHVSKEEADIFMERYWEKLPNVRNAVEAAKQELIKTHLIRTYFGRRRYIDVGKLRHFNKAEYDGALRKSWNTRIQGTAADLLKIGMLRLFDVTQRHRKDVELVLTVHDEVDLLVRTTRLYELLPQLTRAFEVPCPDNWAPIVATVGYGPNWDETSHTQYRDRDPEPFTGWKNVLPKSCEAHIEDEFLQEVA